jgi:pyruvate/2-oxoglutarate dehydrogenase complex dihydrolipoamide acyltransferase (E2) component
MAASMRGRTISMSTSRRLIGDLMSAAGAIPTVTITRRMQMADVAAARGRGEGRPPWPAIFAKGFAIVAADMPVLRRAYVTLPWPHVYEYATSVAVIAVERDDGDGPGVFGCVVKDPRARAVDEIGRDVWHAARAPIDEIGRFRRLRRFARLPLPVRRVVMSVALNSRYRAGHVGTFAVSSVGALGADLRSPRSVWTVLLHYGVFDDRGGLDVHLTFDHRVVDGAEIARALARLEAALKGPLLAELRAGADETAGQRR